jgi:hypothetical protein
MNTLAPTTILGPALGHAVEQDHRSPGERYYRHPGDVIRVVAWTVTTFALVLFVDLAVATSSGVRADLGQAATNVPDAARQLLLAVVQLACVAVPAAALAVLAFSGRWRRAATLLGAAVAGVGLFAAVDVLLDPAPAIPGSVDADAWWTSTTFPTPLYAAAAFAVVTVARPWLSRTATIKMRPSSGSRAVVSRSNWSRRRSAKARPL